ncbi:MAG TPA: hypothetical protein VIL32_17720 [Steroidobacteraceae bacterium]
MTSCRLPGPFGLTRIPDVLHDGILIRTAASRPGIVPSNLISIRVTPMPASPPAAQLPGSADTQATAAEERVISIIHGRNRTFFVDGRSFRLVPARRWSGSMYEAGYVLVPLSEAQAILVRAAANMRMSQAQRNAFEEAASLLADPGIVRRPESGLLLFRQLPPRRYIPTSRSEVVTPSQLARMKREMEQTEHWIEIELVLPDGKAVAGERFRIVTPDGREINGVTDTRGRARVDGIFAEGACAISFPDLYDEEWRHA